MPDSSSASPERSSGGSPVAEDGVMLVGPHCSIAGDLTNAIA